MHERDENIPFGFDSVRLFFYCFNYPWFSFCPDCARRSSWSVIYHGRYLGVATHFSCTGKSIFDLGLCRWTAERREMEHSGEPCYGLDFWLPSPDQDYPMCVRRRFRGDIRVGNTTERDANVKCKYDFALGSSVGEPGCHSIMWTRASTTDSKRGYGSKGS